LRRLCAVPGVGYFFGFSPPGFRQFEAVAGLDRAGHRFAVSAPPVSGSLRRLTDGFKTNIRVWVSGEDA
jgi:hypothetical protein